MGQDVTLAYGRPFRSLIGIAGLSLLGVMLSFGVQLSISKHFGTSIALDGYLLAYTIAMFTTFYVGPVRDTLGPQFFKRLRNGPREAEEFLQPILGLTAIALGLSMLAALVVRLALQFGWIAISPTLQPYVLEAILWLTPAVFLFAASEILNALFACYDRPVLQQAVRIVAPCAMILSVNLAANSWGVAAIAFGVVLGQLAMVIVQWCLLARMGLRVKLGWPARLDANFVIMAGALFANYSAAQLYALAERLALSSFEVGLLSAFNYGVALTNVVITMLGLTIANVIYPMLLVAGTSEDRARTAHLVSDALQWVVFLGVGAALVISVLANEITSILFQRGRFDATSVVMTSDTLRATVFACVPVGVYTLASRALLAAHSSKAIAVAGTVIAATGIAVVSVGSLLASRSVLISHWLVANTIGAFVALAFLRYVLGQNGNEMLARSFVSLWPVSVACCCMLVASHFAPWSNIASPLIAVATLAPTILAIYLFACWVLRALPPLSMLQ
jgi:putative peptidoglycan lipid II flippase